jgi:hypothetical protein
MRRLSDCDITASEAFFKILDILQKAQVQDIEKGRAIPEPCLLCIWCFKVLKGHF